jgi:hypothetical protein
MKFKNLTQKLIKFRFFILINPILSNLFTINYWLIKRVYETKFSRP